MDINKYRIASGDLDINRIKSRIREHIAQVRGHEQALRQGIKGDLPFRESLVYQLENASPAEISKFRSVLKAELNKFNLRGGAFRFLKQTAPGRGIAGAPAASGTQPTPPVAKIPSPPPLPTPEVPNSRPASTSTPLPAEVAPESAPDPWGGRGPGFGRPGVVELDPKPTAGGVALILVVEFVIKPAIQYYIQAVREQPILAIPPAAAGLGAPSTLFGARGGYSGLLRNQGDAWRDLQRVNAASQ